MQHILCFIFNFASFICTSNIRAQGILDIDKELIIKNKIIEVLLVSYNNKGDSSKTHFMKYNLDGNLINRIDYIDNKVSYIDSIEYDNNKRKYKSTRYSEKGDLSWVGLYEYDSIGNLISFKNYNKNGELRINLKNLYNNKNQKTKLYVLDKNSNRFYLKTKSYYNGDNLEISEDTFNSSGEVTSTVNFEYEDNLLIKQTYIIAGLKYRSYLKYDKEGQLIKKKSYVPITNYKNGEIESKNKIIETFEYNMEGLLTLHQVKRNNKKTKVKYFYKMKQ